MFKFKLGQLAQDIITGFKGIITARCDYITGCNQYSLAGEAKDNKPAEYQWFDETRMKIVGETKVMNFIKGTSSGTLVSEKTGGPQNNSPKH